jgi:hypothetical protein
MVREGLEADARNVMLSISAARGGVLQWWEKKAEDTSALIDPRWSAPHWLKLKRLGDRVSAFRSRNGRVWQLVDRVELDGLAEEICVGLAVSILRFRPLTPAARTLVNSGRRGVLLASGEFVDGECRAITDGAVTLSSVPLGLCRYDLGNEVTALVLGRRGNGVEVPWEVVTCEGSLWLASQVELEPDSLRLREPSLGWRRLPFHEVAELRQRR